MITPARQNRPFVLVTGSTGFVGGLVVAKLLSCGIPVAVLVRGNRRQSAADRVDLVMRRVEERIKHLLPRPVVLTGELCVRGLALSEFDQNWIAANCGSVLHSAASLSFRPASEHPQHEPYRTNLDGTTHLLDVATQAGIHEWHYVSTAYVAGLRTGTVLETEGIVGQEFGNDYERSKALAEDLLRQSNAIRSLTVYRPSIVVDLHPTASQKSDQSINTAFSMFQALCQNFGVPDRGEWIRDLGFCGDERKNIVTVDWVSQMIVEIYRRPALHGETYHLTSPSGTSVAELDDSFRAAAQSGSGSGRFPARRRGAMNELDAQAAPFVAAFRPYFRDDPRFDRTQVTHAMRVCSEADVPELTIDMLRDFCLRQAKPTLPNLPVSVEPSAWEMFVETFQTGAEIRTRPGRNILRSSSDSTVADSCLGLCLYGAGGGQWLIEASADGLLIRAADAEQSATRWITSAETFDHLVNGKITVDDALDSCRLLIESDGEMPPKAQPPTASPTSIQFEEFCRLIAAVQCHDLDRRRELSEAVHVG